MWKSSRTRSSSRSVNWAAWPAGAVLRVMDGLFGSRPAKDDVRLRPSNGHLVWKNNASFPDPDHESARWMPVVWQFVRTAIPEDVAAESPERASVGYPAEPERDAGVPEQELGRDR